MGAFGGAETAGAVVAAGVAIAEKVAHRGGLGVEGVQSTRRLLVAAGFEGWFSIHARPNGMEWRRCLPFSIWCLPEKNFLEMGITNEKPCCRTKTSYPRLRQLDSQQRREIVTEGGEGAEK